MDKRNWGDTNLLNCDINGILRIERCDALLRTPSESTVKETDPEDEIAECLRKNEHESILRIERCDALLRTSSFTTQKSDNDFVTEDEIAQSLREKEQDLLSINSSNLSGSNGSISQFSGCSKTGKFDSSLNALMEKKNRLINSIKSKLADTPKSNTDAVLTEDQMNTSATSGVSDSGNLECISNIGTSTPFPESKLPAPKFLRKWKQPSFLTEEFRELDEIDASDDENGYEKAMASLQEVLSDTSIDTVSKLDSYSSMLDAFQQENDRKYDELISSITLENVNLEEGLKYVTKEVDEFIEKSEKNIGLKSPLMNGSTIEIDSKDCTLVASEQLITISDAEITVKDVPKSPTVATLDSTPNVITLDSTPSVITLDSTSTLVTLDSTHLKDNNTYVQPETSQTPVESIKPDASKDPKTVDNVSKENDHDILTIEGDDVSINDYDEELLLASDDEEKLNQSDSKKISSQVPLVKDLEVFISNDPDENKDNHDSKWDYLRNLGTDYDRYKAVRARWKNIQIPNPKKDLTCRCRNPFKQPNGYPTFNYNYCYNYNNNNNMNNYQNNGGSRKRKLTPENQYEYSKKARRESCTMLFERHIDQLANHVKHERQRILNEQEQALQQLADIQHMEKYATKQKGGTMLDMQRLENKHMDDTRNCVVDFRRKMEELMNMARAKVTALQKASEEVRQFHEFYPNEDEKNGDTKSLVYLTDLEVQEILEVEDMLLSFPAFYCD